MERKIMRGYYSKVILEFIAYLLIIFAIAGGVLLCSEASAANTTNYASVLL
jgi:hypothetical protein